MATTAIDRKLLGNLASLVSRDHASMGSDLFVLLGLSVGLVERVATMDRYLKSKDTSDIEIIALRYHIIILIREGLAIVESRVAPFTGAGQFGAALHIMTVKLRASFYYILCLYHNTPPKATTPSRKSKRPPPESQASIHPSQRHPTTPPPHAPDPANAKDASSSPIEATIISSDGTSASLNTNPWATKSAKPIPQPYTHNLPPFPVTSNHGAFIIPMRDNTHTTLSLFEAALKLAQQLPGSAPLRLSVVVDYCSFLRSCVNGERGARKLAQDAVKAVYEAGEGMEDAEFDDAATLVGLLRVFVEETEGDVGGGAGAVRKVRKNRS